MSDVKATAEKKEGIKAPSLQHFRGYQEVEGFYRFIYENDLRREAAKILEFVYKGLNLGKKTAKSKSSRDKKAH